MHPSSGWCFFGGNIGLSLLPGNIGTKVNLPPSKDRSLLAKSSLEPYIKLASIGDVRAFVWTRGPIRTSNCVDYNNQWSTKWLSIRKQALLVVTRVFIFILNTAYYTLHIIIWNTVHPTRLIFLIQTRSGSYNAIVGSKLVLSHPVLQTTTEKRKPSYVKPEIKKLVSLTIFLRPGNTMCVRKYAPR